MEQRSIVCNFKYGIQYVFVLNYGEEPCRITLHQTCTDMDDDSGVNGEVVLSAYETKIYRL